MTAEEVKEILEVAEECIIIGYGNPMIDTDRVIEILKRYGVIDDENK